MIGEFAIRLFVSEEYHQQRYARGALILPWRSDLSQYHPKMGFVMNPNLDFIHASREFSTHVRTNSQGFRDDEKSLDNPDALILGDSYCFGWGIEEEETIEKTFEEQTGLKALNMGLSCYNSVQQFALLQDFCEREDYRDGIVLFIAFNNDLPDNTKGAGPVFPRIKKAGRETFIAPPASEEYYEALMEIMRPKWHGFFNRTSCVGDLLIAGLSKSPLIISSATSSLPDEPEEYPGIWVNGGESFDLIFRRIKHLCEERNLKIFVGYIPYSTELKKKKGLYPTPLSEIQVLSRLRIDHIDLTEILTLEDYYRLDGHLNVQGQGKCGAAIAEAILRLGWIDEAAVNRSLKTAGADAPINR